MTNNLEAIFRLCVKTDKIGRFEHENYNVERVAHLGWYRVDVPSFFRLCAYDAITNGSDLILISWGFSGGYPTMQDENKIPTLKYYCFPLPTYFR